MKPSIPDDEEARLAALNSYDILDSPPEAEYDRIVQLAAHLFKVPIVTISFIDAKRHWCKARVGVNVRQTARDFSFCAHTILGDETLVVPDLRQDTRFAASPYVMDEPHLRFYAGAPLSSPEGYKLGSLCLVDFRPRRFRPARIRLLEHLAAVVVDALQLRRAARENRQLAAVVEGAFTPVVTVDPSRTDRPITYANPAFLQLTGYRREEVLGRSPLLLQGPETDLGTVQEIRAAIAEQRPFHGRVICYRKDGSKFCNELEVSPVFDRKGRLIHYVGLQRNVTEEQKVVEALREGESRFQWVAANEPGMIYQWVTYRDGTPREFRFVSEGCRELFGVEPAVVMQEPDFLFYHLPVEQRPEFARSIAEAAEAMQPWKWQGCLLTPESAAGPEKWVEVKARPSRLSGGDLLWDGWVVDLAERRRTERLRRAQEEVERASQRKDELLARMSEELRAPVDTILGFGRLLEDDPTCGGNPEILQPVVEAGRILGKLVQEVGALAQPDAPVFPAPAQTVALPELVRETLDMLRPQAEAEGVAVRDAVHAGGEPLPVAVDRQRLQQVLLNLLSNAVKYNVSGGYIEVHAEFLPETGRLRLGVRDGGVGVPVALRGRLFTPFDRLGVEASAIPGAGLGLTIARRLTEEMGGTLHYEENPAGHGSVFCLDLPLALPRALDSIPGAVRIPPKQSGDPDAFGTVTILYIEDHLPNIQLVEQLLAKYPQVRLLAALQGSIGLDLVRQHYPSLILLDVHLPDMSSEQIMAQLRGDPATRDIPVVVISADCTARQLEKMNQAGAAAYLTKPLDVPRFLHTINAVLINAPVALEVPAEAHGKN